MTIDLSGRRERVVLSLVRAGKFASPDAVIDEALRLVEQRYHEGGTPPDVVASEEDRTRQQRENLRRLGERLGALPAADVADGLSNRDHDQILYGR